jgi:Xaa-Pro aminopeptidase
MDLSAIQAALREQKLDAWLFYDHHGRDPIAYRVLGLDVTAHVTRRWYYLVPDVGEPQKLVHRIEAGRLDSLPGKKHLYASWQEHELALASMLAPYDLIAMQYSPRNAIMYVSLVDAGTVELLREYDMVAWLSEAMRREDLIWANGPNVSVNENSADSHYEPTAEHSRVIHDGGFLLIDIWGRKNRPGSCFYDITWTGVLGREPTSREEHVFGAVRAARDAAVACVQEAFQGGVAIAGWQADDAARAVIEQAELGEYFTHRTGHNIAAELHGTGAHLDNLETHDERLILPNTCFSVEPGVYLPELGIRSEVNMITSPGKAVVTGRVQDELLRI